MAKRSSSAFYLLCMALLLALAAGALAARHDGPDSGPEDDPTFEPAELSAYNSKSKYKHRYGTSREHYAPDYDHTPHYRGYDREHHHGGYDRPAYKGGDYEGPHYRHRGYDGLSSGPDYYESQEDPSHYPDSEEYGEGGDGYYHHKKKHHHVDYPKPKECDDCPANLTKCPTTQPGSLFQCLDTNSSIFSCGACDRVCPKNSECVEGNCVCEAGFDNCGGECVDLTTNINFCGNCETACNSTQFCVNSVCNGTNPCNAGEVACFPSPSSEGTCRNLNTDPEACGSCNRECSSLSGDTCTNGDCCVGTGGDCRFGFQCCGWNALSLIPPNLLPDPLDDFFFVPTARCQQANPLFPPPLADGRCCQGAGASCGTDSECCGNGDLTCRDMSVPLFPLGNQCQPPGCRKSGSCNDPEDCCAGFRCTNFGILGKACVYVPNPLP